jgi:hypothetical protein
MPIVSSHPRNVIMIERDALDADLAAALDALIERINAREAERDRQTALRMTLEREAGVTIRVKGTTSYGPCWSVHTRSGTVLGSIAVGDMTVWLTDENSVRGLPLSTEEMVEIFWAARTYALIPDHGIMPSFDD